MPRLVVAIALLIALALYLESRPRHSDAYEHVMREVEGP